MRILVALELDIDIARWATTLGFQVEGDKVVSDTCAYTLEDFEECIREYIRTSMYLQEKGRAICGSFLTCPAEQEDLQSDQQDSFSVPAHEAFYWVELQDFARF